MPRLYVVRSFNQDKPFGRFLTEQLAGDELVDWRNAPKFTPEILDSLLATGYLRTMMDLTDFPEVNSPPYYPVTCSLAYVNNFHRGLWVSREAVPVVTIISTILFLSKTITAC